MERNTIQQNQRDVIPIHFTYKDDGACQIQGEIAEWEQNNGLSWTSKIPLSLHYSYNMNSTGRIKRRLDQELFNLDEKNKRNRSLKLYIRLISNFRPDSLIFKKNAKNIQQNEKGSFLSKEISVNGIPLNQFNYNVQVRNKETDSKKGIYHLMIMEINSFPIGLRLCDQTKFPIKGDIKRIEWKNNHSKNNVWCAPLNVSEKPVNLSKKKKDRLGSFYQLNACKPEKNGKDLYVKIFSKHAPANLDFVFKSENGPSTGDFILFTDLKKCFTLNGNNPTEIKNDHILINDKFFPAITLDFADEKQTIEELITQNNPELSDRNQIIYIGILPFSVVISDDVKARIQPDTMIDQIRNKFVGLLKKQTNIHVEKVSYPRNIAPFSQETIDLVPPTLKKDIINTPEKILTGICKIQKKDKLIIGNFEEDLISNQLILCVRLFDCATQEMISLPLKSDIAGEETFSEKMMDEVIKKLVLRLQQAIHKFAI